MHTATRTSHQTSVVVSTCRVSFSNQFKISSLSVDVHASSCEALGTGLDVCALRGSLAAGGWGRVWALSGVGTHSRTPRRTGDGRPLSRVSRRPATPLIMGPELKTV